MGIFNLDRCRRWTVLATTFLLAVQWCDGDDGWRQRGLENSKRFDSIQSHLMEGDLLEYKASQPKQLSYEAFLNWWRQWPESRDAIEKSSLEALLGTQGLAGCYLRQFESLSQGDRGKAVSTTRLQETPLMLTKSQTAQMTAEYYHLDGAMHNVETRMAGWGGSGNWDYPIMDRFPWVLHMLDPQKLEMIDSGQPSPPTLDPNYLHFDHVSLEGSTASFVMEIDPVAAVTVRYGHDAGVDMLAADTRTLSNGCRLPFRVAIASVKTVDGQKYLDAVDLILLRQCVVNTDLTQACLHPVGDRQWISAEGIAVKGGPEFFLQQGVPDVFTFVEGKMVDDNLAIATPSLIRVALITAVSIAFMLAATAYVIRWHRRKITPL